MGEAKRKRVSADQSSLRRREELERLFQTLRIDYSQPGFYDDSNFLAEERRRPSMLETYGEWVTCRERTAAYDGHVRGVLAKLAPIISSRLDKHQWFGGCFAVTAMLTRMLDRLGVWNTVMKGAASVYVNGDSRHFTTIDENQGKGYETGHSWIIAPPFDIVDLTLYHQWWQPVDSEFQAFAPKIVLAESTEIVRPRAQDVIAPALLKTGTDAEMYRRLPDQRRFGAIFPPRRVLIGDLDIRYVASGMTAPQEPLEGINTVGRAGVPALEIWREDVAPAFGLT
jgi:hypothetical protein